MDRLDEQLRHGLKRLSEPVAAGPILESVARRKNRKRLMRRAEVAGLVVVVIVGSLAGTYGLLRIFGAQGPRPAFRPEPAISAFEDLPQGWTELPQPPEFRDEAATVWTGDRLIAWGGTKYGPGGPGSGEEEIVGDGFVFDARTNRWSSLPPSPITPRRYAGSAWNGQELLIWGGEGGERFPQAGLLGDGAAYDPVRRSWRLLPEAPISPRAPYAVWTGREFIVWGTSALIARPHRDGAAYDPSTNSWRRISDAPIELNDATAVWTGQEMIVFGTSLDQDGNAETENAIGAAYDPENDSWRRLPDSRLSPQASTAVWTGRELVSWDYDQRSAAYDPEQDRWGQTVFHRAPFCAAAPIAVAVTGYVIGSRCGPSLELLEPGADRWRRLKRPGSSSGSLALELVAADPVALVLTTDFATDEIEMLAYRPTKPSPASASERSDTLGSASALLRLPQCTGTGDRKERRFHVRLPAAVDEETHTQTSPPTTVTDVEIVNTSVGEAIQLISWLNLPAYIPDWPKCEVTEINHDGRGSGTITVTLHGASDVNASNRALDLIISDSLPLRLAEPRRDWTRLSGGFFWDRRGADSIPAGLPRGTRLVWMSETKHYYELMGAVDLIEALRIAISTRRRLPAPEQSEEVRRICAQLRAACSVRSDFSSR